MHVRQTELLYGATGIITPRRAQSKGVFAQGHFHHYSRTLPAKQRRPGVEQSL